LHPPLKLNVFRAARPFTPRNAQSVTLSGCGIATHPSRATDAVGLSPTRLQPCRPLPTPKPLTDKLQSEISRILRDPVHQERFSTMGLDIIASTPQEFSDAMVSEIKRWAKVVQDANIKAE
jgi:hypothetical protein